MVEKSDFVHNLSKEKKLIDLLGYHLLGPDNSNRWIITDKQDTPVGFIQYKKQHNKKKRRGLDAVFGYNTIIDSDEIYYNETRNLSSVDEDENDYAFNYSFDIKRDNVDKDSLTLSIGKNSAITLWSRKYGFIDFSINKNKVFLNFKRKNDKLNIGETIRYDGYSNENISPLKKYFYQVRYCDKSIPLTNDTKNVSILDIEGSMIEHPGEKPVIDLTERTWKNMAMTYERRTTVDGTIEDMIIIHEMGIDAVKYFTEIIRDILPFSENIFSAIFECVTPSDEVSLFFPEYFDGEKKNTKR